MAVSQTFGAGCGKVVSEQKQYRLENIRKQERLCREVCSRIVVQGEGQGIVLLFTILM